MMLWTAPTLRHQGAIGWLRRNEPLEGCRPWARLARSVSISRSRFFRFTARRAGKPAFVSMIGLLSSRPPFGRIEPAAEIGSRATDGRPLEQALAEIAVVAALALEQD